MEEYTHIITKKENQLSLKSIICYIFNSLTEINN